MSRVNVAPKESPWRMSTHAPKIRPVASETNLSHGSVWMPRVTPRSELNDTLFCTGPKSGRPTASIFSRCQFSLKNPRSSSRGRGGSLALLRVLRLRRVLVRTPPVLVGLVPLDGVGQTGLEVLELRLPAELLAQLARLDGVAQVVPGAVVDVVEGVLRLAHQLEDQADD